MMLLVAPGIQRQIDKEKAELRGKISQPLASQNTVRDNNEPSYKTDWLQMHINSLKVPTCALEERLLSGGHRAQMVENQTKALIMRLAELQRKFKPQPRRASAVKVRALIGKEQDPVSWGRDVWEDPMQAENFEPSDSQGFLSSEQPLHPQQKTSYNPKPWK